jgi:hypothetical protein
MTETPDGSGSDFLDSLLKETPPQASQPRRGQNYNYPLRHFLKPDGTVVKLQGDPQNRAYYQDKGYRMLGQAPGRQGGLSEEQQYTQVEFPKLLEQQRMKAALINAIRRAGERYRDLNLEDTFDDYTIEEIREYLKDIKADTGKDIRVIQPRRAQQREEALDARLMAGVETAETQSLEGLQSMLTRQGRAPGELIQGQGYDPIDQARRQQARGRSTST